MMSDPTRIDISTDPTARLMNGVTAHGGIRFVVPYISEIAKNLWQGGFQSGLVLPSHIKHVVSLYPWERYQHTGVRSELYVEMYDSEEQTLDQVPAIAAWVNACRNDGPTLVHCQAGLNRSALVVAHALWAIDEFSAWETGDELVQFLRNRRSPAVLCNPAFENAVRSFSW